MAVARKTGPLPRHLPTRSREPRKAADHLHAQVRPWTVGGIRGPALTDGAPHLNITFPLLPGGPPSALAAVGTLPAITRDSAPGRFSAGARLHLTVSLCAGGAQAHQGATVATAPRYVLPVTAQRWPCRELVPWNKSGRIY